ncbi:MAG: DUF2235 domain-containing protein [Pseudomonadota bacterium]
MTQKLNVSIGATIIPPLGAVKFVSHEFKSKDCMAELQVGIFFDGTNNNKDRDTPRLSDSNISRLFKAYPEKRSSGLFPIYIPGVGTPFPEIGEPGESDMGSGFGIGCEARVLYGLLSLLNAINFGVFGEQRLVDAMRVQALCHAGATKSSGDSGKICPPELFRLERELLSKKIKAAKPLKIAVCNVDVFGFSRGAAEARVFCNWLDAMLDADGALSGVPICLRFVGLFDTVASAGFWTAVEYGLVSSTPHHGGWADATYLLVPPCAVNCVHMVAMHELRRNFPLDELATGLEMPKNWQEFAYPGAHSDVGGGYAPNDLGISVGQDLVESDSLKLAQIPLNHMFDCAVAAGLPMDRNLAKRPGSKYDPFAISPKVQKVFNDFLNVVKTRPRPMREWLQYYLTWRWQVRLIFDDLVHVQKACFNDQELLRRFNGKLKNEAEAILRVKNQSLAVRLMKFALPLPMTALPLKDEFDIMNMDPEALEVLCNAQQAPTTPRAVRDLFDGFVHDSLAGFNRSFIELPGYWRYRKAFAGGDTQLISQNESSATETEAA